MCARFSDGDHPVLAARADELRARAVSLAPSDLAAYADYVQARRAGHDGDVEVIAALDETIGVPLEMAEVAAELAELAGGPPARATRTCVVTPPRPFSWAQRRRGREQCSSARTWSAPVVIPGAHAAALVASASAAEQDVLSLYPALATP